mmetsp:Transcript_69443/g.163240  ORF Transcript_69443/g.163240 Transcript_69443/m.163240 type:complete len:108 (+) Transcript_69443:367-690(+)
MVTQAAMRCGFTGGLLVDYPHSTKAKKYYMVLFAGHVGGMQPMPQALGTEGDDDAAAFGGDRARNKRRHEGPSKKDWVVHKKARQRMQGREVRPDTKYTARKRRPKF